ncbi:diacylglycerol kinase family protein [Prosthecobacter vanneervenii]|uniref:Diacylglycerol kinase (ATP) n=1 Tax=Prosthecobacter vanneervenii TaxID=48466 RepID=A0A7W8DIG2_9BACT|nr:diacylglycerol kinase family protein [Prosthecobacter vanneervenii]MBB5031007.1 diacylglycerol kinase (ATP) [Prosthecobacter vanneervenii]
MHRWLASVVRSFGPALAGVAWALKTQKNLQFHAGATVLMVVLGFWLGLATWEWCAVTLAAGIVWAAELMNTALEVLADRVSLEREEAIRRAKDAAAGAVLMAAVGALGVGLMIFLPKLWVLL